MITDFPKITHVIIHDGFTTSPRSRAIYIYIYISAVHVPLYSRHIFKGSRARLSAVLILLSAFVAVIGFANW